MIGRLSFGLMLLIFALHVCAGSFSITKNSVREALTSAWTTRHHVLLNFCATLTVISAWGGGVSGNVSAEHRLLDAVNQRISGRSALRATKKSPAFETDGEPVAFVPVRGFHTVESTRNNLRDVSYHPGVDRRPFRCLVENSVSRNTPQRSYEVFKTAPATPHRREGCLGQRR